jgi:Ca2+-binding RTX toxin-like protein
MIAHKASYRAAGATFKKPKLEHGLLRIKGTRASDNITLRLQVGDPRVLEVAFGDDDAVRFSFERADVASIVVDARGGDDHVTIDEGNGAFTDTIPTAIDGGDGDDTLVGGSGAEVFDGGYGNDSIDGNKGNDRAAMGAGDDTFVWDPGDGSDTIEGDDGADTMLFNGADAADQVDLSANGSRLKFFRQPGNVTMDTAGVERVDFNALGGADTVVVNNLAGTDVTNVDVDLGADGNPAGQADQITVNGTNDDDTIAVAGGDGTGAVTGLAARVGLTNADPADDTLTIDALDGDDVVDASGLAATAVKLQSGGGNGDDRLVGSSGDDILHGDAGDDVLVGGRGQDVLDGGAGNNLLIQD